MVFLLIAAVCGALFSIIFKVCQRRGIDTMQAILFNYVTAILVAWIPLFAHQLSGGPAVVNPFNQSWIWLALLQGLFFMSGFIVMAQSTRRCGVALTTVAARASLVIPVVLSWVLLAGPAPQWLPVGLVVTALVLMAAKPLPNPSLRSPVIGEKREVQRPLTGKTSALIFFLVFLFYGIADFSLKAVQNSVSAQCAGDEALVGRQLSALTGTIFVMAALLSLLVVLCRPKSQRKPFDPRSIVAGAMLGLANLGCTTCILRSLTILPAATFFPLYNIAIVILGTLAGILLFKERIRPLQYIGLAIAIVAIVLFFR